MTNNDKRITTYYNKPNKPSEGSNIQESSWQRKLYAENSLMESETNIETRAAEFSALFFYADNVYHGLDAKKSVELELHLPRKKNNLMVIILILSNWTPSLNKTKRRNVILGFSHFYLKNYPKRIPPNRTKGGLKTITIDNDTKSYDLGDSTTTIAQIRQRLFITEILTKDSKSAIYDKGSAAGVLKYKKQKR
jgi:hypothetical protein